MRKGGDARLEATQHLPVPHEEYIRAGFARLPIDVHLAQCSCIVRVREPHPEVPILDPEQERVEAAQLLEGRLPKEHRRRL